MIELDGSMLEGGGQILRTALAFSALMQIPIKVKNIRKSRPGPGLKAQHISAVQLYSSLCSARVKGDKIGSTELVFRPQSREFHNLNHDIGTAGSITLLLQSLLPYLIFADKTITLKLRGGTDTAFSPPIDYLIHVLLPHLKRYADISCTTERRGYYPEGQGKVHVIIRPIYSIGSYKDLTSFFEDISESTSFSLTSKKQYVTIYGVSHASKDLMKADVAERQAKAARLFLQSCPADIQVQYSDTISTGSGITLWAKTEDNPPLAVGSSALGERGKPSEKVGKDAALMLVQEMNSEGCVDKHLADQLIPYLFLSSGSIKVSEITNHTKTNLEVMSLLTGKEYTIEKDILTVPADIR